MPMRVSPWFRQQLLAILVFAGLTFTFIGAGSFMGLYPIGREIVLVVTGAACLIVVLSVYVRGLSVLSSPVTFGWLALVGLTGLTVLLSEHSRRSIEYWQVKTAVAVPIAYAILVLRRAGLREDAVVRSLMLVTVILFVDTAFAVVDASEAYRLAGGVGLLPSGYRVGSKILGNPNIIAFVMALMLPIGTGYLLQSRHRSGRLLTVAWLVAAMFALILTGSRLGILAAAADTAVTVVFSLWGDTTLHRFRLQRRQLVPVVAVIVVGALLFGLTLARRGLSYESERIYQFQEALEGFLNHPFAGTGPGTFMIHGQRARSSPPYIAHAHPHNLFLDMAVSSGLLGLAGLAIWYASGLYAAVRAWRVSLDQRSLLAGSIGALVAFTVTGLFDQPAFQTHVFAVTGILLMLIAAHVPVSSGTAHRWGNATLLAGILVITVISAGLTVLYGRLWQADLAFDDTLGSDSIEDWRTVAAAHDALIPSDPYDPLLALQSAYAWAEVGLRSGSGSPELTMAITRLDAARAADPANRLHPLNLSQLYAANGDMVQAIQVAHHATLLAPDDELTWLNLGQILEAAGETGEAEDAYLHALMLRQDWVRARFWQTSTLRGQARAAFESSLAGACVYCQLEAGETAWLRGDTDEARRHYEQVLATLTTLDVIDGPLAVHGETVTITRDRQAHLQEVRIRQLSTLVEALIALTGEDQAQAEHLLTDVAATSSGSVRWDALFALADLYHGQDAVAWEAAFADAIQGVQSAIPVINVDHAVSSFHRIGFSGHLLNRLPVLDVSDTHLQRLTAFAEQRAAQGHLDEARDIYALVAHLDQNDT